LALKGRRVLRSLSPKPFLLEKREKGKNCFLVQGDQKGKRKKEESEDSLRNTCLKKKGVYGNPLGNVGEKVREVSLSSTSM